MKIKKTSQILKKAYFRSISELSPGKLLPTVTKSNGAKSNIAVLCWGKAAWQCFQAYQKRNPHFVTALIIAPEIPKEILKGLKLPPNVTLCVGEHPVPRDGSFQAGKTLLYWLKFLNGNGVKKLQVLLSGGASSLAWLPPSGVTEADVTRLSEKLYRLPLGIEELNKRRAKICLLKGGGTTHLAKILNPGMKIEVDVISDVLPFGVEVIGSGPFWSQDKKQRPSHRVLADNEKFVCDFVKTLTVKKETILVRSSAVGGAWKDWVQEFSDEIEKANMRQKKGCVVIGGEAHVSVPQSLIRPKGGRLTQIALGLLLRHWEDFMNGKLELLCGSSDGVDGRSGGAGVFLDARSFKSKRWSREVAIRASRDFNAGWYFHEMKCLLPEGYTGTNVQDLVAVRIL